MRDIATKVDNTTSLSATDFNALNNELENAALSADLILDPAGGPDTDLNMLGKALSAYANAGAGYTDSGAADAYVVAISSNLKSPSKYYDNMIVTFVPGNSCTGASTINVSGLGLKAIEMEGSATVYGDIIANKPLVLKYDGTAFQIMVGPKYQHYQTNVRYTDEFPDFATALTAISTTPTTLVVVGTVTISVNTTVADNITLLATTGNKFTVASTKTLTINGPVEMTRDEHFIGAGSVVFSSTLLKEVYPQWWGATGDGSTDDTAAIQSAVDSLPDTAPLGGIVSFGPGDFLVSTAIEVTRGLSEVEDFRVTLQGDKGATILRATSAIYQIDLQGDVATHVNYLQYPKVNGIIFAGSGGLGINTRMTKYAEISDCSFLNTSRIDMSLSASETDANFTIKNNIFEDGTYGIQGGNLSITNGYVSNNYFTNQTVTSLHFNYLDGGSVKDNMFFNDLAVGTVNTAIDLVIPKRVNVSNNKITSYNGNAVRMQSPYMCTLDHNIVTKCGVSGSTAVLFDLHGSSTKADSSYNTIDGNRIENSYGNAIAIVSNSNFSIINNSILDAGYLGTYAAKNGINIITSDMVSVYNNHVDGNNNTEYWLSLNTITTAHVNNNTFVDIVNVSPIERTAGTGLMIEGPNVVETLTATGGTLESYGMTKFDTTSNAIAKGLIDGFYIGETKILHMTVDGGNNVVITPTTFSDGTTITMADVDDHIELRWLGASSGWKAVFNLGCVIA